MSAPHFSSWQKMRKKLKSFLAHSLVGRVDYMLTSYRHAHDGTGHAEIWVDGHPVTNFCEIKAGMARWSAKQANAAYDSNLHLDYTDFVFAAGRYLNEPLEESLAGVECGDKTRRGVITPNTEALRRSFP